MKVLDPYFDAFNRWTAAINAYHMKCKSKSNSSETFAVGVLEVYRLINAISLDAMARYGGTDNPMIWDNYTDVFAQIVTLIEALQQSTVAMAEDNSCKSIFTLNLGIVGPLYDIAMRCRDPQIRRRAIRILFTWHRREGMWDSVLAARVAEAIVNAEEDAEIIHSSADVPAWRRISTLAIEFQLDKNSCSLKIHRKSNAVSTRIITIEKIIRWE